MSILKIVKYPNPILRKKAKPIENISSEQREILKNMTDTMYKDETTVGLAAEQVNLDTKLMVIDVRDEHGLLKLINPVIKEKEGKETAEEGCLSLPGISVTVLRAKKIKLEAQNERGERITLEADGFLARVLQHEIDHLNGKIIIDYLNPIERLVTKIKCYMRKLRRKDS